MALHHISTSCSTTDVIDIFYFHNKDSAQKTIDSFLNMYELSLYLRTSADACKSKIIVICCDASLQNSIDETLEKLQGHELRMMVIICPEEKFSKYPEFNLNNKIKFWTYLTCSQRNECVSCTENELARRVFRCFMEMIHLKSKSESPLRGASAKPESSNILYAMADKRVEKSFSSMIKYYLEKKLSASFQWIDEKSKHKPVLAICLNTDNVENEVQQLQMHRGIDTILVVINVCAQGVSIQRSSQCNSGFSNVIDLRFDEYSNEFYGNESSLRELMKLLSEKRNENTGGSVEDKEKHRWQIPLSRFMNMSKHSQLEMHNVASEDKQTPESKKSKNLRKHTLQFLCKAREDECKKLISGFKMMYHWNFDIVWKASANDIDLQKNVFLVCLKLSRLEDDIAHTISSVHLSDTVKPVLIILHHCVKGVQLNDPLPTKDVRFKEVINILYNDESGCYECNENERALKKMKNLI